MTLSFTKNFRLAIPDFLSEPWHAEFAAAMQSIDTALTGFFPSVVADTWVNNRLYLVAAQARDAQTGLSYICQVQHTSSDAVTAPTMATERALFPNRWQSVNPSLATQLEAEAGLENTKYMSALRVAQAIDAQVPVVTALGFSAHKNGVDQTGLPNATITKVTFGTELYDLGGFYDAATSRWTPPAGIVCISAGIHVPVTVLTPGHTNVYIHKNGVAFKTTFGQNVGIEGITSITISDRASGTDFYEVFVSSPSGSTYMVAGGTTVSWFMGHVVQKV